MYLHILKKDLKRNKTMNIVLLIFTILAAMFVSSGIRNVVSVMTGTDYFLEKAGIGDYMVIAQNNGEMDKVLDNSKNVTSYKKEVCFWATKNDILVNKKKIDLKNNMLLLQSIQKNGIKYFYLNNDEVKRIKKGDIYVSAGFFRSNNVAVGDKMNIKLHGINKEYRIAGEIKDAFLGSDMIGNTRLLISDEDYSDYKNEEKLSSYQGSLYYINSNKIRNLESEISYVSKVMFSCNKDMLKLCYVMEMLVAMIVLVLSVCLVIVSFVLLKFVISFSISEEYREIGVMKAMGIRNIKIRSLYIMKYFVMSVVGGSIGFIASIPLGDMLMDTISEKMILGNDSGIILNIIGAIVVVIVMIFFAYLCTAKVKKTTPVDAIRNGQTGERYSKKGINSFMKSHSVNAFYMAVNDILSSPKRYITIILSFLLCSVFVFGLVEVADTMKSDRLIGTFGKKSDVYITDSKILKMELMSAESGVNFDNSYKQLENDLKKLNMPGKVCSEVWYKYPLEFDGNTTSMTFQQNTRIKASVYEYIDGTAPQNENEIAITPEISKMLRLNIGDEVVIDFGVEKKKCIVTGTFQTMNQLGKVIRLHENAPTRVENVSSMMAFQIDFDDKITDEELRKRIDKIKKYYDIDNVFNAAEYCDDCMGVADTMDMVSKLLLVITCIVVILSTVLMERSFIVEEKGQIALLKAIGFKNRFIMKWHVYRFMIVAIISEIFAILLTYPITKLWCDPIWNMMGAKNVDYYFKPFSLLVIYPGIILIINFLAVWFTALFSRKITSRDVLNIE